MSAQRRPDFDLLVIGELNVDLLLYGYVTPVFGQAEKLVDDAVMTVGSSSAIFAHQAARLGLEVAFCGKVGADAFGTFMTDRLERAGIDTSAEVRPVAEDRAHCPSGPGDGPSDADQYGRHIDTPP